MNKDTVQAIKQAILRDLQKSLRNAEDHRAQMNDPSSSIEYRQAAQEAFKEWDLLRGSTK